MATCGDRVSQAAMNSWRKNHNKEWQKGDFLYVFPLITISMHINKPDTHWSWKNDAASTRPHIQYQRFIYFFEIIVLPMPVQLTYASNEYMQGTLNLTVHALWLSLFKILPTKHFSKLESMKCGAYYFTGEEEHRNKMLLAWERECVDVHTQINVYGLFGFVRAWLPCALCVRVKCVCVYAGGTSVTAMSLCAIHCVLWMAQFSVWMTETDPVACCEASWLIMSFSISTRCFLFTHTWLSLTSLSIPGLEMWTRMNNMKEIFLPVF